MTKTELQKIQIRLEELAAVIPSRHQLIRSLMNWNDMSDEELRIWRRMLLERRHLAPSNEQEVQAIEKYRSLYRAAAKSLKRRSRRNDHWN